MSTASSLKSWTRALWEKARALQQLFTDPLRVVATGVEDDRGDQFRAADRVLGTVSPAGSSKWTILTQHEYSRRVNSEEEMNEGEDARSASGDCTPERSSN